MDHQRASKLIRSKEILAAALDYAIFDRLNSDYFYDPTEIGYASTHKDELLEELVDELKDLDSYRPRIAFAYYPPKNDLCDRRMVYIPIKDLTVRYAVAIVFSNEIESDLSTTCFANRRAQGKEKKFDLPKALRQEGGATFVSGKSNSATSILYF